MASEQALPRPASTAHALTEWAMVIGLKSCPQTVIRAPVSVIPLVNIDGRDVERFEPADITTIHETALLSFHKNIRNVCRRWAEIDRFV